MTTTNELTIIDGLDDVAIFQRNGCHRVKECWEPFVLEDVEERCHHDISLFGEIGHVVVVLRWLFCGYRKAMNILGGRFDFVDFVVPCNCVVLDVEVARRVLKCQ